MDQTRKSRSLFGFMGETRDTLRDVFVTQPRAWLVDARKKISNLPKTNYDLGCDFAERGQWFDAIFRFRIVLYLQPNYPNANYNLGCSYFRVGKLPQAAACLKRALQQNPANQDAVFMLAAIDPAALPPTQRPHHMPREMVTQFFTSIALDYDTIEMQNQYKGGVEVANQTKPFVAAEGLSIIDLGCGTGIAARPWRAMASSITGVDITPAMVTLAGDIANDTTKLFDRVVLADISAMGELLPAGQADLVLAVNTVQFVGALDGMLAGATRALKQSGILAITIEPFNGTGGYGVNPQTGRFGHSAAYVKQQASAVGLGLAKEARTALYPGSDVDVLIFRKGTV